MRKTNRRRTNNRKRKTGKNRERLEAAILSGIR